MVENGSFTYGSDGTNGSTNLSPTFSNNRTNGNGTFTFSIPLSLLGNVSSFNFATTYLNGPNSYRSNEAIGNSTTDQTASGNTGSLGRNSGLLTGFFTFSTVPEPGTWLAGGLLCGLLVYRLCVRRGRLPLAAI